jgi:hypothetical protein
MLEDYDRHTDRKDYIIKAVTMEDLKEEEMEHI